MYTVTDEMVGMAVARVTGVELGRDGVLYFFRLYPRFAPVQFTCYPEGVYLWSDGDGKYCDLSGIHERLFWKLIVNHVLFSEGDAPA